MKKILTAFLLMGISFSCGDQNKSGGQSDRQPEETRGNKVDEQSDPDLSGAGLPRWLEIQAQPGASRPRSPHLTWQRDPGSTITFTWNIDDKELDGYVPRAWLAEASAARGSGDRLELPYEPERIITGTCTRYTEILMGVEVGEGFHGACSVEVTGLTPDTEYLYRVGTWTGVEPAKNLMTGARLSPVSSFSTGPEKGSRRAFTFVSAGDSRGGYPEMTAHSGRFARIPADFWLFNGDMNQSGDQAQWHQWFDAMAPVSETRVIMPVHGNHEIFANVFYEMFPVPRMEGLPEDSKNHGWSFDYGNLHIIGLDTNSEEVMLPMVDWLEQDLQAASTDPDIDWIIVMTHYPPYSSSTRHGSAMRVRQHFVPLFDKYGVDVVFAGHDHVYERTLMLKDNQVVESGGTFYVIVGGFFSPGYDNGHEWFTAVSHGGDKGNYSVVKVDGEKFTLTAYSGDGTEILDSLELTR